MAYVSPYGRAPGLIGRLTLAVERMRCDRSFPWVGTGLIDDMEAILQLLNRREFLDHLRVHGDDDARRFAGELSADLDTIEATESAIEAAERRGDWGPDGIPADPPAAVEAITDAAIEAQRQFNLMRGVLVQTGALADDDDTTDTVALLRALLS